MRALVLISTPCEDLARAICPSKDAVGECYQFVEREVFKPAGPSVTAADRQTVCKGIRTGKEALAELKARMLAQWESRWFLVDVTVEATKPNGSSWDPEGGLPDLAFCAEIKGGESGCYPEGRDAEAVSRSVCVDEARCLFNVFARRGATVAVDVLDVDINDEIDQLTKEHVGTCAFTLGAERGQCEGPVTVALEGGGSGAGSLERRFLGRWVMDIEATLARELEFKAMSIAERVKAIEVMAKEMADSYFHFGQDGWLTTVMRGDMKQERYSIVGMKGATFTLKLTATGRADEAVEVQVTDRGLRLTSGKDLLVLRRAPF